MQFGHLVKAIVSLTIMAAQREVSAIITEHNILLLICSKVLIAFSVPNLGIYVAFIVDVNLLQ